MLTEQLTPASLATFMTYARDAGNWGNNPWVSNGNVNVTKAMRGNLSDLSQKGFIEICNNGDGSYIEFTESGKALAAENGVEIS